MVVGGLMIVFGLCMGGVGSFVPLDQLLKQQNYQPPPGMDLHLMKMELIVMSVLALVAGIAEIAFGFFVRRGSRSAAVGSIVINLLIALFLVGNIATGIWKVGMGSPQAMGGLCFWLLPIVLLGLLISWLMHAVRGAAQVEAMRQALQQQGWGQPQGYGVPVDPRQAFAPPYGNAYGQQSWPQPPAPNADYGYGAHRQASVPPPQAPPPPEQPLPPPPSDEAGEQGSKDA